MVIDIIHVTVLCRLKVRNHLVKAESSTQPIQLRMTSSSRGGWSLSRYNKIIIDIFKCKTDGFSISFGYNMCLVLIKKAAIGVDPQIVNLDHYISWLIPFSNKRVSF